MVIVTACLLATAPHMQAFDKIEDNLIKTLAC